MWAITKVLIIWFLLVYRHNHYKPLRPHTKSAIFLMSLFVLVNEEMSSCVCLMSSVSYVAQSSQIMVALFVLTAPTPSSCVCIAMPLSRSLPLISGHLLNSQSYHLVIVFHSITNNVFCVAIFYCPFALNYSRFWSYVCPSLLQSVWKSQLYIDDRVWVQSKITIHNGF